MDHEEDTVLRIRLRSDCPCGSGRIYNECCRDFHMGRRSPNTAEELMRSRYSAFFFRLPDYIVGTTHPDSRSPGLRKELDALLPTLKWRSLSILSSSKGQAEDKKGKVEFVAEFDDGDGLKEHYENSRFRRFKGVWKYVDDKG